MNLTEALNDALPQTQCTRCGYPDCHSYAQAMAQGQTEINQCPPGGAQGIERLAKLLGRRPLPLNPAHGQEGPRQRAVIDENACIGCTLCLEACPVDSIVGGPKHMHTVTASTCTGCELCLPVCPVDCISMQNACGNTTGWDAWSPEQAQTARDRFAFHQLRQARQQTEHQARLSLASPQTTPAKQTRVAQALAKARAQRDAQ